ncbi:hypothetical protein BJX65DRAFT_313037 [Aspergillus insuetus]
MGYIEVHYLRPLIQLPPNARAVLVSVQWPVKPTTAQRYRQATHDAMGPLRGFTPDSGAYINEANIVEPNFQESFWGAKNYVRLSDIKRDIDPDNLLTVHQGAGFDAGMSGIGVIQMFPYEHHTTLGGKGTIISQCM